MLAQPPEIPTQTYWRPQMCEPRDFICKTVLSVIDESEVPDMGPKIWVQYEETVEAHIVYPVGGRAPRSMVWNMCFWEGKTKAR